MSKPTKRTNGQNFETGHCLIRLSGVPPSVLPDAQRSKLRGIRV